jgi:putative tricarboxylic transport membrane protein
MRKGDLAFAIISLGLSVWLILESLQFDYLSKFGPGPGFEPFWLGVLLGLLSIFLFINTIRRKKEKDDEKSCLPGWKSLGRLGLIMLALAGFGLVMESLGFILTVFIFVTILLYALEGVPVFKSIFIGILFSAFIFLVFIHWMQVELPKGFLGL